MINEIIIMDQTIFIGSPIPFNGTDPSSWAALIENPHPAPLRLLPVPSLGREAHIKNLMSLWGSVPGCCHPDISGSLVSFDSLNMSIDHPTPEKTRDLRKKT
jgi:hypothetical protein